MPSGNQGEVWNPACYQCSSKRKFVHSVRGEVSSMTVAYRNVARFFLFFRLAVLLPLVLTLGSPAHGQAAAETAGATSMSAKTAASSAKPPAIPGLPASPGPAGSAHLIASSGPPADVKNRQALEQNAGPTAAKLLIRSVPTAANVWIDGAYVGKTPMLLILAPGKYQVKLRDQRQDYAESNIDLLPRETREYGPTLTVRYPTRATVR